MSTLRQAVCALTGVTLLSIIPTALWAQGIGRPHALLIACAEYDRKELNPLAYTRNDVTELAQALRDSGVADENMVLMHDQASRDFHPEARKIRKQLSLLLARVGREDSLIVALAGHGVQFQGEAVNYFCPVDAELQDRSTLIPIEELYRDMQKCKARRKLLLVDACRNDPQSGLSRSLSRVQLESITRPQREAVPEGIVALFSCAAGQRSYEHPDLKHGIFFHHVIQALHGEADADDDGQVSLDELIHYTKQKTQAFAHLRLSTVQLPQQRGEFSGGWMLRKLERSLRRERKIRKAGMANPHEQAVRHLTEAIRLEPEHAQNYYNRGEAYYARAAYDLAIEDYTDALSLDPRYAAAYTSRGRAHFHTGDLDRALADYNRAIRLEPDRSLSYYDRANWYFHTKDYARSLEDYNKAIALYPDYAYGYHNRGNIYLDRGEYDRAIADYTRVIQGAPQYAEAYVMRARAFEARGDAQRATADREMVKRLAAGQNK